MSCREMAALRIGLATLLGDRPESEVTHERLDLGRALDEPGPLRSLAEGRSLADLRRLFGESRLALERRAADVPAGSAEAGYVRTLAVACKAVDLGLERLAADAERFYRDLETLHEHLHPNEALVSPGQGVRS